MPKNSTDEDAKVFDVAKPESSSPQTGSKPMVIGHKSLAADPSIRQASTEKETTEEPKAEKETVVTNSSSEKIRLEPISTEGKTEEPDKVNESEKDTTPDESTAKSSSDTEPSSTPDVVTDKAEPADGNSNDAGTNDTEQTEQDKLDEATAKEDTLQELINSREYVVPIKQASDFSLGVFLITFMLLTVVCIVVIVILIDAGVVDLGIELPFNFIQ